MLPWQRPLDRRLLAARPDSMRVRPKVCTVLTHQDTAGLRPPSSNVNTSSAGREQARITPVRLIGRSAARRVLHSPDPAMRCLGQAQHRLTNRNAPDRSGGRLAEPPVGIEPTTYSLRAVCDPHATLSRRRPPHEPRQSGSAEAIGRRSHVPIGRPSRHRDRSAIVPEVHSPTAPGESTGKPSSASPLFEWGRVRP
jgi:hypothetical protein